MKTIFIEGVSTGESVDVEHLDAVLSLSVGFTPIFTIGNNDDGTSYGGYHTTDQLRKLAKWIIKTIDGWENHNG